VWGTVHALAANPAPDTLHPPHTPQSRPDAGLDFRAGAGANTTHDARHVRRCASACAWLAQSPFRET